MSEDILLHAGPPKEATWKDLHMLNTEEALVGNQPCQLSGDGQSVKRVQDSLASWPVVLKN